MAVDRFSRSVGKFPGTGIAVFSDLMGSEGGELLAGHVMLEVKVGGNDEEATTMANRIA